MLWIRMLFQWIVITDVFNRKKSLLIDFELTVCWGASNFSEAQKRSLINLPKITWMSKIMYGPLFENFWKRGLKKKIEEREILKVNTTNMMIVVLIKRISCFNWQNKPTDKSSYRKRYKGCTTNVRLYPHFVK